MAASQSSHIFGPAPSRRLGRSLGVDLVPFKTCNYDCVYCQLGRTTNKTSKRRRYVAAADVLAQLREKLQTEPRPDYITLSGSGEPTLHSEIGKIITGIKRLTDVPVAVLTNGSLLWRAEVRTALTRADVVLPSLDAGDDAVFRRVNRPVDTLQFDRVVAGIEKFTHAFRGEVWLEVFLLAGVSSTEREVGKIARIAKSIDPARVQLNTVARPPAEESARAVSQKDLRRLCSLFGRKAEVIAERHAAGAPLLRGHCATEVRELLGRRPCTLQDIATGLGLHVAETAKLVGDLAQKGVIGRERSGRREFYVRIRSRKGGPHVRH